MKIGAVPLPLPTRCVLVVGTRFFARGYELCTTSSSIHSCLQVACVHWGHGPCAVSVYILVHVMGISVHRGCRPCTMFVYTLHTRGSELVWSLFCFHYTRGEAQK